MRETMILILMLIATTSEGRDLVLSAPLEPVQSTTVYAGLNGQISDIRLNAGIYLRPGTLVDITLIPP